MGQRLYLALKLRRAEYHDMITHTIAKSHCTCETVGTRGQIQRTFACPLFPGTLSLRRCPRQCPGAVL